MTNFEERLKGGHPNSLGNTVEIVEEVLDDHTKFDELFNCYFSTDEVVRLRVSNAMKRICKAEKQILLPYLDRLLSEIATIQQPSTQWTLSQLFRMLVKNMNEQQTQRAKNIMKNNLANHSDWIVLTQTMETLSKWSKKDTILQVWLLPHLERLSNDSRKSVARKAQKQLEYLNI